MKTFKTIFIVLLGMFMFTNSTFSHKLQPQERFSFQYFSLIIQKIKSATSTFYKGSCSSGIKVKKMGETIFHSRNLNLNIDKIILIDQFIKTKSTGTPDELALKIGLTKRSIFHYVKFMKEELNAPIAYSSQRCSYVYEEVGSFGFKWKEN